MNVKDREVLINVIFDAIDEMNTMLPIEEQIIKKEETALYGKGGALDSMGIVSFIALVEQKAEEKLGVSITLASDKAMSRGESPFATVGKMADHVAVLLSEIKE